MDDTIERRVERLKSYEIIKYDEKNDSRFASSSHCSYS